MAIASAVCNSFKTEILTGTHNFTASTGDTFKIALYYSNRTTLDKSTTAYDATNEVAANGNYAAGGGTLVSVTPALSTDTACCNFNALTFQNSTITARCALIYNNSKSNKAVATYDFGSDKSSTAGNFTITFPTADAANAILRIA